MLNFWLAVSRRQAIICHLSRILFVLICLLCGIVAQGQIAHSPWPKAFGNPQNTSLGLGFGTVPVLKWVNSSSMGTPVIGPDGTVYCSWSNLTAIDGQTGVTKYTAPVVIGQAGGYCLGVDGYLFGSTNFVQGSSTSVGLNFSAVNTLDGSLIWTQSNLGNQNTLGIPPNIGLDGSVYVGSPGASSTNLFALDPATGNISWSFTSGVEARADTTVGPDGTLYSAFLNGIDAIDPASGKPIWNIAGGNMLSHMALGSNGNLYYAAYDSNDNILIYSIDSKTGNPIWSTNLGSVLGFQIYAICLGPDNSVLIDKTAVYGDPFGPQDLIVLDGTSGATRWTTQTDASSFPAIGADGTIYVGGATAIHAFSGKTGDLLWDFSLPSGTTYVGSSGGGVGNYSTWPLALALGADGSLYASTSGGLYCLDSEHVTLITISPSAVYGGQTATGTVTMSYSAPTGGAVVNLTSPSANISFPPSVTIPAGQTTATFTITTQPVDLQTTAVVSATPSNNQTATLTINPAALSGLSLNPTTLQGGASSAATVTLGSPAGPSGIVVNLTSSNSAASVPATVTVSPGQTTGTFSISTSPVDASTGVSITASYGANAFTQTLTVTPPSLETLTLAPTSVQGGSSATGTINLTGPAGPSGTTINLSSSSASATVPTSVKIAPGQSSTTFTVSTTPVASKTSAVITVTFNNQPLTATLTVTPATLASLTLNPSTVQGGTSSSGTVSLSGAAPSGGVSVALSSGNSAASVANTVIVPAGQSTATFTVSTIGVNKQVSALITATLNGTPQTTTLTITPATLSSVTLNPANVQGGTPSTGTVTLTGPAGAGGTTVALSSNSPAATVPTNVIVPSGQTSATFTVGTSGVNAKTTVIITGTLNNTPQTASLTINAVGVQSLAMNPNSVSGGNSTTGTITLNGPAAIGGSTVSISSNSNSATPPTSVTIAQGQTKATFQLQTSAVSSTVVATVTASLNGTSQQALLTVNAPVLLSLTISPSTIAGAGSAMGTLTLSGIAPAAGITVTLSSSSPSASVVTTVVVPSGQASANFTIIAHQVSAITSAKISATANSVTKSATLTLNPIQLISLVLSPSTLNGGSSSSGTLSLNGPAGQGGVVVHLKSSLSGVTVPATATIAAGQSSVTFAVKTVGVSTQKVATITGTLGSVTESATLTVNPPVLSSITLSPSTVTGSQSSVGTVTLSGVAPSTGMVVKLTSSSSNATVLASVTIPSGKSTAVFAVKTLSVSAQTSATISAALNGVTETATLTINPPTVLSLTLSPTTVKGGSNSTGKVTINAPAPKEGIVVTLAGQSNATVPASLTIAAGSTTGTFTVKTTKVTAKTTATISAATTTATKTAVLSITP